MSGKLLLTPVDDGKYELAADFGDIPAGFVTDGASIPRIAWRLIGHPFESEYIEVFVEHDYDYATGRISRAAADDKMLQGLKAKGMGYLKRYTIYWAVRLFGSSHYAALILACFCIIGCAAPKARYIDLAGAYVSKTGTFAVGSVEIQTAPENTESAMISYSDSVSWFRDIKEHRVAVFLTGTNSVLAAPAIVTNICSAFVSAAPYIVERDTKKEETAK
jgi:hypothetical protein